MTKCTELGMGRYLFSGASCMWLLEFICVVYRLQWDLVIPLNIFFFELYSPLPVR